MILDIVGRVTGSLRIDNLTVRYGDALALDGVTAEIPPGCSVAVIGPNAVVDRSMGGGSA